MIKKLLNIFAFFLLPATTLAANLPPGIIIDKYKINDWMVELGNFMIGAGVTLAVIMIVYSGIKYMTAGGDSKGTTGALETLKSSIIGIAIILGVGLIIKTITSVVTDNFFR